MLQSASNKVSKTNSQNSAKQKIPFDNKGQKQLLLGITENPVYCYFFVV